MAKAMQTVSIEDYAAETKTSKATVIRATASPLTQPASSSKSTHGSSSSGSAASKKAKTGGKKHDRVMSDTGSTAPVSTAILASPTSAASMAKPPSIPASTAEPFYVPAQQLVHDTAQHPADDRAASIEMTLAGGSGSGSSNLGAAPTMAFDLSANDVSVNIVTGNSNSNSNSNSNKGMLASSAQQRVAQQPVDAAAAPHTPPSSMAPAAEAPGDQEVMPEPLGGTPQMLAQLPPAVVRNGVSNGVVEREAAGARQLPAQFQTQTPALPALPVVTGALRQAVGQSMVQMSAQSLVPVAGQSLAQVPMLSSAHSAQPATRAIPPATPPAAAPKMAASIAQQQQQQQPHAMVANFNRPATPAATPAATGTAAHASALSSSAVHPVQTSSAVQQQQQQQPSTAQPSAAVSQHAPTTQPTAHASTAAVTAATPAAKPSVAAAAAAAKPVHPRPASQTGRAGPADAERHGDAKAAGTRLSDGFIVLISIAIMFVCALLFYFYMRQRRRRAKRRALHHAAHGSLLHSHSSLSLPSGRGGGGGAGGDKFSRVLTRDSGTSLSLREPRTAGGGGAANDEKLFPIASLHDVHAAETLDRRYLDYRSGSGSGGGEKGVGTMAQSLVDARHARFGAERRVAGAISFDNVAPVRARLPPSPLQQQMQQPPVAAIPAYAGACSQRSLLDTSAANPALAAAAAATTGGAAGAGGGGVGGKPRKLVRDTFRGGNNSSSSNSGSSSPAGSPKQPGGKPSHGSSVKTMLRSLAPATPPPAARTAPRSPDAAADRPADRASPLLDSIESISDSYQFAVRHRPPLGPLRVVEPHVPALADELAVDRGHHMFVVGEFADGWVLAVNISRNSECGMIPRRCLFFPTAAFMTADAVAASA